MILEKREVLMNSVSHAQFNYYPNKNKMKFEKTPRKIWVGLCSS